MYVLGGSSSRFASTQAANRHQQCYKAQSAEISTLLNLFRHIFSPFLSFYV